MKLEELVGHRVQITSLHAREQRWDANLRGVIFAVSDDINIKWDNGQLECGFDVPAYTSSYKLVEDERPTDAPVWPDDLILEP